MPPGYIFGLLVSFVLFWVGFGYLVGSFLVKIVRARVMLVGSVVYWALALVNWLYLYLYFYYHLGLYQIRVFSALSEGFFWSMGPAVFTDVTYMVKYLLKRRRGKSQLGRL